MLASIAACFRAERRGAWLTVADRRGVTMLEYGLMAGLIALVCVTALNRIAPHIVSIFNTVANSL
jgi:Flp pilus assembly pilin Flp